MITQLLLVANYCKYFHILSKPVEGASNVIVSRIILLSMFELISYFNGQHILLAQNSIPYDSHVRCSSSTALSMFAEYVVFSYARYTSQVWSPALNMALHGHHRQRSSTYRQEQFLIVFIVSVGPRRSREGLRKLWRRVERACGSAGQQVWHGRQRCRGGPPHSQRCYRPVLQAAQHWCLVPHICQGGHQYWWDTFCGHVRLF